MPQNPVLAFAATTFIVAGLVIDYFIGGLILNVLFNGIDNAVLQIPFLLPSASHISLFFAQIITMFGACIVLAQLGCGVYLWLYAFRQEPATPGYGGY
jgi:hypothetical protein